MSTRLLSNDSQINNEDPVELLRQARILLIHRGENKLADLVEGVMTAVKHPDLYHEVMANAVEADDWYQR